MKGSCCEMTETTHQLRSWWCTKKPTSSSHGELLGRVRQRHNFKALGMRIYMNLLYAIVSKSRNGAIHHFLSGHECHQMPPGFLKVFKDLIQVYFAANVFFNTAVDAGKPTRESGWRRSEMAGPGDLTLSIQSFCQRMDTVQFHLSICIFTRSNSSLSRDDLYDLQPCLGNNLTI